ncbi:MAG TPA: hypothetical protein VF708_15180 [Pyrinomonadaceae bacterium]
MKRISMIVIACLLILMAATTFGQTRRRTTSKGARASSTKNQSAAAASSTQTAAARLAEQIKSLGKFLYLYGPISKELANSDSAGSAQSNPSSSATEMMQQNRAKLRDVFRNYRVQMDELEATFSGSTQLRQYYPRLLGVAASAARGEEFVAAGRYDEAGRSLLDVMNRLTDVLLAMR